MLMTQRSSGKETESSEATGKGEFYHIEVKSPREFKKFRTQDVGKKDGIERVAGQRADDSWDTVKWLVSKELAHVENGRLVADREDAKELFNKLGAEPKHISGDRFKAKA